MTGRQLAAIAIVALALIALAVTMTACQSMTLRHARTACERTGVKTVDFGMNIVTCR